MALHRDGHVATWGDRGLGQTSVPVEVTDVIAITAGNVHNLTLHRDGHMTLWTAGQASVPAGLTDAIAIAAGGMHSLALHRVGTSAPGEAMTPVR